MAKNNQYMQAEDALKMAAEAAAKINDPQKQAEILTQIGHGFIRLGTETFQPNPKDDTGAGFQPYEQSR